ncbi:MAG: ABC transporter ATP-binding protein [Verrucomicrobia bacterium]|nr:ABC transporter ATP-binding protein [Verrucomicrobiota bacterium]
MVALSGLDLQVPRGAVCGLIGRNGAGKTTTLRLLMGLLRADRGRVRVLGADLWIAPRSVRARVAYVSQSQQLPGWMTFTELNRYASHFYEAWDQVRARELARAWAMPPDQPVGALSGGEQRKAAVILALASRPEVMLLDEPSAGLDPIARRELVDALVSVLSEGDGCTVLLSTQVISDLERLVEYVGIMDRGRMLTSARLEELQQTTRRVQIIFPGDAPPSDFSVPGALRSQTFGPVVNAVAHVANDAQLDPVRRLPGVRVQMFPLGLEEIFIELAGRAETRETPEPINSATA